MQKKEKQKTRLQKEKVADASNDNWVDSFAPNWAKPYLRLARLDRPIGIYLLFWPCVFSLLLANIAVPELTINWLYLILFFIGATVMRGAGCTFNDIVDRDIDKKVARTQLRPIPSGQVSVKKAIIFLLAQSLIGLIILLQFNLFTIILGASSLLLVAIYPFMKRITYWPQLFLGLAFSWGALIGYSSQTSSLSIATILLYIGSIMWTIGYDTIYAMQDIEDDAMIGVKSTARLFGKNSRLIISLFYIATIILWLLAGLFAGASLIYILALALPASLLIWQIKTLKPQSQKNALIRFKANHYVGLTLSFALILEVLL
jgi:4-hydroxybenzoate polyprenyltransferase